MRSIGLWRRYINITVTVLNIIHSPAFYLKQWIMFVYHRKHITSPRRAQPVNAIYRFMTTDTIITIAILDTVYRLVLCLKWNFSETASIFRLTLRRWRLDRSIGSFWVESNWRRKQSPVRACFKQETVRWIMPRFVTVIKDNNHR
jgi:hypothetical protein